MVEFDNFGKNDLFYICGNFTDQFAYERIQQEPSNWGNMEPWQITYAVALVHHLCLQNELVVPNWIRDKKFILEVPVFQPPVDMNSSFMIYMMMTSPYTAKLRHLYIPFNSFTRC